MLLNHNAIQTNLKDLKFARDYILYCLPEIDSTNNFLKRLDRNCIPTNQQNIILCCAEMQTAGRGRFNRAWISPFGCNIYFSGCWLLNINISKISGLSLIIGLAVVKCLNDHLCNGEICLKWPNDIIYNHQKLGGILIEFLDIRNDSVRTIIGIGINVNTPKSTKLSTNSWCSLLGIHGQSFDRNILLAKIIHNVQNYLEEFIQYGFSAFKQRWDAVDYLHNKPVTVIDNHNIVSFSGIASGVDDFGQLCVNNNQINYVTSNAASVNLKYLSPK